MTGLDLIVWIDAGLKTDIHGLVEKRFPSSSGLETVQGRKP